MNLYHGSNLEVREPKIIPSKRLLDFAVGFYLTSDFEQARKWAIRTTNIRKTGQPTKTGSGLLQQIEREHQPMQNMI